MKKPFSNKFPIFLNVILILFLIGYFLVPFLSISWLTKVLSPTCYLKNAFQGEEYLAPWCEDVLIKGHEDQKEQEEEDGNLNINAYININSNTNTNTNSNTNINGSVGIANPAAVKCLEAGGISEPYQTAGGEAALCVFKDSSICEEWAYFRGECQEGKCIKKCDAIGTRSEGWYNSCTKELIKYDNCAPDTEEPDEAEVKNIILSSPLADAQLSSPFEVIGKAKVGDNKVNIRVKSKSGQALIELNISVKNIGADGFGDFKTNINYEFSTTKEGFVDFYSVNQETQAEENLISIPVKF